MIVNKHETWSWEIYSSYLFLHLNLDINLPDGIYICVCACVCVCILFALNLKRPEILYEDAKW